MAPRLAYIALFVGVTLAAWGVIFVRLSEVGPLATGFWRLALAVPVLAGFLAFDRTPAAAGPRAWRDRGLLVLAGVFFGADLAVWHQAILMTKVVNAALFAGFTPLIVTVLSWVLFGQRFRRLFLLGLGLALVGSAIVVGPGVALGLETLRGDALALLAAVFYAGFMLIVAELRGRLTTAVVMTWSTPAAALSLLPLALIAGETVVPPSAWGWGIVIALALLSQCAGQGLGAYALRHLSAPFAGIVAQFQPAIIALLGWVVLSEPVPATTLIGGAVTLVGIILAQRSSPPPRRLATSAEAVR